MDIPLHFQTERLPFGYKVTCFPGVHLHFFWPLIPKGGILMVILSVLFVGMVGGAAVHTLRNPASFISFLHVFVKEEIILRKNGRVP